MAPAARPLRQGTRGGAHEASLQSDRVIKPFVAPEVVGWILEWVGYLLASFEILYIQQCFLERTVLTNFKMNRAQTTFPVSCKSPAMAKNTGQRSADYREYNPLRENNK